MIKCSYHFYRARTLFQAIKSKDFSRTFQDPTWKLQGLFFKNNCTSNRQTDMCCALVANEREHWERITQVITYFVSISRVLRFAYLNICFHWILFTLKALRADNFWSCSIKKSKAFKDRKQNSSTFKALKSDSWNSRFFKGFQDAYEPCFYRWFLRCNKNRVLVWTIS